MKVNIRDTQIGLWQELADLIGAKHPADAVSYIGARYLPALIAKLRSESDSFPNSTVSEQIVPAQTETERTVPKCSRVEPKQPVSDSGEPKTDFDDLFDSIAS